LGVDGSDTPVQEIRGCILTAQELISFISETV
jgi:hypothetical protein